MLGSGEKAPTSNHEQIGLFLGCSGNSAQGGHLGTCRPRTAFKRCPFRFIGKTNSRCRDGSYGVIRE